MKIMLKKLTVVCVRTTCLHNEVTVVFTIKTRSTPALFPPVTVKWNFSICSSLIYSHCEIAHLPKTVLSIFSQVWHNVLFFVFVCLVFFFHDSTVVMGF